LAFHETLLEVSAASGVDADIDNYRTFHVFNHGFSNNNWQRSTPVIAPMATSQRLNASNDLDCMVEVKCVGLNYFVDGAVS
jgi:hypothetical protein